MPRTRVALVVLICLSASVPALAELLTDRDRQRLQAHLEMTEAWLASEVAGLSPAQMSFRSAADKWSVADVVEHLAVAEAQYWTRLNDSMKQPAGAKTEVSDGDILWYGIDRANRARTGEARVPTGRWKTLAEAHAVFTRQRAAMRDYARTTSDDLRSRRLLEGNMDVYQWFLMISSHSQRHILQIREIKADPAFPK